MLAKVVFWAVFVVVGSGIAALSTAWIIVQGRS